MQIVITFNRFLIACQNYYSYIKHVFYRKFVACTNSLRNQFSATRDVGDKYSTFRSLDTLNLPTTDVRYNYPVSFLKMILFCDSSEGRRLQAIVNTALQLIL